MNFVPKAFNLIALIGEVQLLSQITQQQPAAKSHGSTPAQDSIVTIEMKNAPRWTRTINPLIKSEKIDVVLQGLMNNVRTVPALSIGVGRLAKNDRGRSKISHEPLPSS